MDARHREEYEKRKGELVGAARQARKMALSYREFKVGAAILTWNGEQYAIFTAANVKPHAGSHKVCAEPVACAYARTQGARLIVAVVVAAQPQEHDATPTLHPCAECRDILEHLPETEDDTIIHTVHDRNGAEETFTLEELLKFHSSE